MPNYHATTANHAETGRQPVALRPAPPPAVRNAARVMYAGAVASVMHIVVDFVTTGDTKAAIAAKHPHLSAGTLGTLTTMTVIATAVVMLIGAMLFIWIARGCTRGKNSARITATVLAVLGVLFALYDISAGRSTANLIMSFAVAAIGWASVAFLWQRSSSAYFRHFRRPQF